MWYATLHKIKALHSSNSDRYLKTVESFMKRIQIPGCMEIAAISTTNRTNIISWISVPQILEVSGNIRKKDINILQFLLPIHIESVLPT